MERKKDELLSIKTEYKNAKRVSENNPDTFFKSVAESKYLREIYILGEFCRLLIKSRRKYPIYFKKTERPDFETYEHGGQLFAPIEIVETMHKSRKRGLEHKEAFNFDPKLMKREKLSSEIWNPFRNNLINKISKNYGEKCWLIMYHNIPETHISDCGFWINMIPAQINILKDEGKFDNSLIQFERIFILNSSFREMMQIHPCNEVIYSKWWKYANPGFYGNS